MNNFKHRVLRIEPNNTAVQTCAASVCVCFLPIHSGHQVRWTYQPGSHRRKVTQDFSSTFFLRCVPSFFSREEFSHSFPSSTVKSNFVYKRFTNDLIVLHSLGIFSFSFSFFGEKNPVCGDRIHGPTCQKVTWLPLRGDRLVGVLNLHLINTAVHKILSYRMLRIKGSTEYSRWTCVDRPSCSVDEKLHINAPHRNCLRKRRLPASACLFSLESSVALSRTVFFSNRCAAEFNYKSSIQTTTLMFTCQSCRFFLHSSQCRHLRRCITISPLMLPSSPCFCVSSV